MRTGGLGIAILVGLVALGQAAPLDPRAVAGGATWVAHLDVDAMRASIVVQNAYREFVEKCPIGQAASPMLDASRAILGLDPREDLQGITLYGTQLGKEQGVLIVYAKVNQGLLEEKVKRARGYESGSHGPHTLHTWIHRDPRGERRVTGAFYKDQGMVFSGSKEDVEAALDVLDGKRPSLTHPTLAAKIPAGAMVLFRAVGIAEIPGASNWIQQIESAALVAGENEGRSFLEVHVEAKSPQAAELLGKIAEGVRAAASLHAGGGSQDREIAAGMKVRVADKTVSVEDQAPAEVVWRHLQGGMEKIVEHYRELRKLREGRR